jgi:tRNA (cmo5U34)-methyltransferase
MRDEVFRNPRSQIVDFVFDESVAAAFPDMIRRSVPGYETVVPISGLIAARHARAGGRCYDLGCSLGATAMAILRQLDTPNCRIVGVDNSAAMLDRARALHGDEARIEWLHSDVRDVPLQDACAVVMNYTLQFVPNVDRLPLLTRIREALDPSGVLIVSEKVRFADEWEQNYFDHTHVAYKRANGYSALEVAQKRTALEKVLVPDRIEDHEARFRAAGFGRAHVWFRCLNWVSFVAML